MLVYFKTNTDYRKYKLWTICVVMVAGKFYFAVEKIFGILMFGDIIGL